MLPYVVFDRGVRCSANRETLSPGDQAGCGSDDVVLRGRRELGVVERVVRAPRREQLGVPIDKSAAEALYVGIRTDTGGFNFRNISPRAHELVADLLRAGVVPAEVTERINRRGSRLHQPGHEKRRGGHALSCGNASAATAEYEHHGNGREYQKIAIESHDVKYRAGDYVSNS